MKKYTYLLPIFIWLLLWIFESESNIVNAQYLLQPAGLDCTNVKFGDSLGTYATNKHDSATYYIYFNQNFFGGENGNHTELLVKLHDSLNCKGVLPSMGLYWAFCKWETTLVKANEDCTGYWQTITDSLKIYNEWVRFTLKDSLQGIVEGIAIMGKTTTNDTSLIDSTWQILADGKFNTR